MLEVRDPLLHCRGEPLRHLEVPGDKDTRHPKARLSGAGSPGHILTLKSPLCFPTATADGCCSRTPEGYMAGSEDSEQESKNMGVIFLFISLIFFSFSDL